MHITFKTTLNVFDKQSIWLCNFKKSSNKQLILYVNKPKFYTRLILIPENMLKI